MTLGDKIRKYRTLKGLTQAQLGSMVQLTGDRIRQYENDVRKPKEGKLFEIADALDVNPSTLAEPDFDDPTSVMHVLFELEDIYGFHFEKVGDNYQLAFSKGDYENANWIIDGIAAWGKNETNCSQILLTPIVPLQIRKTIISAGKQDIHIILQKKLPTILHWFKSLMKKPLLCYLLTDNRFPNSPNSIAPCFHWKMPESSLFYLSMKL